jgi:2'-5' RNA ligase
VTQSVELLLDDALEEAVRAQWQALADAGLPSQARHTGPTNRPHVTLAIAAEVDAVAEAGLVDVAGRLPIRIRLGGLVCFASRGGGRQVIARLAVPNHDLLAVQASVAAVFDGLPGTGHHLRPGAWTAHVTLARNLPTERLGDAALALGEFGGQTGDAVALRRWDSIAGRAWNVTAIPAR